SATRRASLALGSVVRMASCSISEETMLPSIAKRWLDVRLSFLNATRWRMAFLGQSIERRSPLDLRLAGGKLRGGLGRPILQLHAERKAHLGENFLDFLERLTAEVLRLEHFRFGALNEVADRLDVGLLQAVGGAHRKLQLVDRPEEVFVQLGLLP